MSLFKRGGFLALIAGAIVVLAIGWIRISRPKPPVSVVDHPRLAPA